MPDSSSSVAASRARLRPFAPALAPSATCRALSAALVRGNASHASALKTSCVLPARIATMPCSAAARSKASAPRACPSTKRIAAPDAEVIARSPAAALSAARSGSAPPPHQRRYGANAGCARASIVMRIREVPASAPPPRTLRAIARRTHRTSSILKFACCRHAARFFVAFSKRRRAAARSRRSYLALLVLVEKRGEAVLPRFSTNC